MISVGVSRSPNQNYAFSPWLPHAVHPVGNGRPLFTEGGISGITALQLLEILDSDVVQDALEDGNATARHFSAFARGGEEHDPQRSGGVWVRLFDQVGNAPTGNFSPNPSPAQAIAQFTSQMWQAVHFDGNILTLLMNSPYRNHSFSDEPVTTAYENSDLRDAIINEFTATLGSFPASVSNTIVNTSRPGVPQGDRIFIPSYFEMASETLAPTPISSIAGGALTEGGVRGGIWELNGYDRAYRRRGLSASTWTRTASTGNNAFTVLETGAVLQSTVTQTSIGVRPAIQIRLAPLRAAAEAISEIWDEKQELLDYIANLEEHLAGLRHSTRDIAMLISGIVTLCLGIALMAGSVFYFRRRKPDPVAFTKHGVPYIPKRRKNRRTYY